MFPICKNILQILPKNKCVDGNLLFHTIGYKEPEMSQNMNLVGS